MTVSDVASSGDQRLPRGRHGIAAEAVAASQQERLLRAVVRVIGERGWSETRIADVVAEAAVSRRTFYELYGGLEPCFAAAVDAGFAQLVAAVDAAAGAEGPAGAPGPEGFESRVRRFLVAYLGLLSSTPGATRALHVEMVRATEGLRAQHDRIMEAIGERLLLSRFGEGERGDDRGPVPADLGVALVAGFEHLLSRHIRAGGAEAGMEKLVDTMTAIAVRVLA